MADTARLLSGMPLVRFQSRTPKHSYCGVLFDCHRTLPTANTYLVSNGMPSCTRLASQQSLKGDSNHERHKATCNHRLLFVLIGCGCFHKNTQAEQKMHACVRLRRDK